MGRKRIDTSMYFCPNKECSNYGKVGPDNQIIAAGKYGKNRTQMLRCKVCRKPFSARRITLCSTLRLTRRHSTAPSLVW